MLMTKQMITVSKIALAVVSLRATTMHASTAAVHPPIRQPGVQLPPLFPQKVFTRIRVRKTDSPSLRITTSTTPATPTATTTPTDTDVTATTTPLAELAHAFEDNVLEAQDPDCVRGLEINMPKLLLACRRFETAMRRFGEQRSAKDLHNNILKVESLYHSAPADKRDTMSSLLQYEKELGIHPTVRLASSDPNDSGQRLRDPSAAMGLLWIRRSLAFNCKWYSLMLESGADDDSHPLHHPRDAALAAYKAVLERYHGWAVRRLSMMGMQSAIPPRHTFLARLGGFDNDNHGSEDDDGGVLKQVHPGLVSQQEEATVRDVRRLVETWQPLITNWQQIFQDLDLDDTRRV